MANNIIKISELPNITPVPMNADMPLALDNSTNGKVKLSDYRDAIIAAQASTISSLDSRIAALEALNLNSRLTALEEFRDRKDRSIYGRWNDMTSSVGGTNSLITGSGDNANPTNSHVSNFAGSVGANTIVTFNVPTTGVRIYWIIYKAQVNYTPGTTRPSDFRISLLININSGGWTLFNSSLVIDAVNTIFSSRTFVGVCPIQIFAGNTYSIRIGQTNNASGGSLNFFNLSIFAQQFL